MAAVTLDWIKSAVEEYIENVNTALTDAGRSVEAVIAMAPGVAPAWDNSCSQLYGRFISVTPNTQPSRGAGGCGIDWWNVRVAIALTRCVGKIDTTGGRIRLPKPAQVGADGFGMLDDLAIIGDVIKCDDRTREITAGRSLPESGGMAGVEWEFVFKVDDCGCTSE